MRLFVLALYPVMFTLFGVTSWIGSLSPVMYALSPIIAHFPNAVVVRMSIVLAVFLSISISAVEPISF